MNKFIKTNHINSSQERAAGSFDGYGVAGILVAGLVTGLLALTIALNLSGPPSILGLFIPVIFGIACFIFAGFYMVQPNQAVAILLFGAYSGTDRKEGLRWTWPWMRKIKISLRSNNVISEQIKVNDLRGNPIEIASQVVWRVTDTAQALFDVHHYQGFVMAQIEAGVRSICSRYPYDDIEHQEITLRENHMQIANELREALNQRLRIAGIVVDECGLTHLAYATEIAGAMLRRQQADAVISARTRLVDGAVSMVEMALEKLAKNRVVNLDDERKAAMVSNLMVVLCSDQETQPVINAGTLS